MTALLSVKDLRVGTGKQAIVDGVTLTVDEGETLALVGESGCGKSLTSLSIIRLLAEGLKIMGGEIHLRDQRLDTLPEDAMNRLRGAQIGMIFQEPVASLDPLMPVGRQIAEALRLDGVPEPQAMSRAVAMLEAVGIVNPELRATQFPFELSGGMCQRIMIAMAMIRSPKLLIADEPTTALDVTIQKQILQLMRQMQQKTGTAILLVTHDMGVVAESTDRVCVMYAGRIVESGPTDQVLAAPHHPYTALLLATTPRIGGARKTPLPVILRRRANAGCSQSRCPSSSVSLGARLISPLCGTGTARPAWIAARVCASSTAPLCERRSSSSPLVRAGSTLSVSCPKTGPVSSPFSSRKVLAPVISSPAMTECWTGAAPRQAGSREKCRLIQPCAGMASARSGISAP